MRGILVCRPSSLLRLRPNVKYRPTPSLLSRGTAHRSSGSSTKSEPNNAAAVNSQTKSRGPTETTGNAFSGLSSTGFSDAKVKGEFASLLEEFGLAEVPRSKSDEHGVEIDHMGQLKITNEAEARRKHKTALVLSPAAASLSRRDFLNLLKKGKHIPGWRVGGLEEIIPVRALEGMRREPGWILIFGTPAEAHDYQHRANKLRALVRKAMPESPTSGIQRAPDHEFDGLKGFTVRDYTLSTPWQSPILYAHLHPFPQKIQQAIDLYQRIMSSSNKNETVFPVRVWIDEHHQIPLDAGILRHLITWDGHVRGTPWQIADGSDGEHREETFTRLTGRLRHKILDQQEEEQLPGLGPKVDDNWRVLFSSASNARRFVRVWHKRPLPDFLALRLRDARQPLLKAECLFQEDIY